MTHHDAVRMIHELHVIRIAAALMFATSWLIAIMFFLDPRR